MMLYVDACFVEVMKVKTDVVSFLFQLDFISSVKINSVY